MSLTTKKSLPLRWPIFTESGYMTGGQKEGNPCEWGQKRLPGRGETGAVYWRVRSRWMGRGNKGRRQRPCCYIYSRCLSAGRTFCYILPGSGYRKKGRVGEEGKEIEKRKRKRKKGYEEVKKRRGREKDKPSLDFSGVTWRFSSVGFWPGSPNPSSLEIQPWWLAHPQCGAILAAINTLLSPAKVFHLSCSHSPTRPGAQALFSP